MALIVDTNKTQNLELSLIAADFHFCLDTQDFPVSICYSPASVSKIDITNRYLIELKLLYDINPGGTYIFEGVRYVGLSFPLILLTPPSITPRKFALLAKDPILFWVFDQMLQICHTMVHFLKFFW